MYKIKRTLKHNIFWGDWKEVSVGIPSNLEDFITNMLFVKPL